MEDGGARDFYSRGKRVLLVCLFLRLPFSRFEVVFFFFFFFFPLKVRGNFFGEKKTNKKQHMNMSEHQRHLIGGFFTPPIEWNRNCISC